jgi:hypothetical protein
MMFGILLLPSRRFAAEAVRYATSLADGHGVHFLVGDVAPPHVTIAHVDCDESVAREWWRKSVATAPTDVELRLSGVKFEPKSVGSFYNPAGGVSFSIEATRTDELDDVQRTVLGALPPGPTVMTGVGEQYAPHMSLGVFESTPHLKLELPPRIVMASTRGFLALGEVGAYGTFPRLMECVRAELLGRSVEDDHLSR